MAKKKSKRSRRQHASSSKSKTVKSGKRGPANSETRKAATTHRSVTWKWDDEDFRACSEREQRACEQYEQFPPSDEDIYETIRNHIQHMEKGQGPPVMIEDPIIRRDVVLATRKVHDKDPIWGDHKEGIIAAVQKAFPGTPWGRAWNLIQGLEKKGKIYLDKAQTRKHRLQIWRVATAKPPQVGRVMTDLQRAIWDALERRAMTGKELVKYLEKSIVTSQESVRACVGRLRKVGYQISNRRGRGYFRPDAPPNDESATNHL